MNQDLLALYQEVVALFQPQLRSFISKKLLAAKPELIALLSALLSQGYSPNDHLDFSVNELLFNSTSRDPKSKGPLAPQPLSSLELKTVEQPLLELMGKVGLVASSVCRASLEKSLKDDSSLVTNADLEISTYFVTELERLTGFPVVSEENIKDFGYKERQALGKYWLVDPIDGTKAFAAGTPHYCHMASFIEDGVSTLSCIYLPELDNEYIIGALGQGVFRGRLESKLKTPSDDQWHSAKEAEVCAYVDHSISEALNQGEFAVEIHPLETIDPEKFTSLVDLSTRYKVRLPFIDGSKDIDFPDFLTDHFKFMYDSGQCKLPLRLLGLRPSGRSVNKKWINIVDSHLDPLSLYLAPYQHISLFGTDKEDLTIEDAQPLLFLGKFLDHKLSSYYHLNSSYQMKLLLSSFITKLLALFINYTLLTELKELVLMDLVDLEQESKLATGVNDDKIIEELLIWASYKRESRTRINLLEEVESLEMDFFRDKASGLNYIRDTRILYEGLIPDPNSIDYAVTNKLVPNDVVLNDFDADFSVTNLWDVETFNLTSRRYRYPYYLLTQEDYNFPTKRLKAEYLRFRAKVDYGIFNDRVLNIKASELSYKPFMHGVEQAEQALADLLAASPQTYASKVDQEGHCSDILLFDQHLCSNMINNKTKLSASGAFLEVEDYYGRVRKTPVLDDYKCAEHKAFHLLYGGNKGYRLFGRYPLPLRRGNFSKAFMHSAGVKTYYMLRDKSTAYLQSSIMSEWDLAPAACFLTELGGAMFDLARQKFLSPQIFNRIEPLVPPMLLLTNRAHLPLFLNLNKLAKLETAEVTNLHLARKGLSFTVDELYQSVTN